MSATSADALHSRISFVGMGPPTAASDGCVAKFAVISRRTSFPIPREHVLDLVLRRISHMEIEPVDDNVFTRFGDLLQSILIFLLRPKERRPLARSLKRVTTQYVET